MGARPGEIQRYSQGSDVEVIVRLDLLHRGRCLLAADRSLLAVYLLEDELNLWDYRDEGYSRRFG